MQEGIGFFFARPWRRKDGKVAVAVTTASTTTTTGAGRTVTAAAATTNAGITKAAAITTTTAKHIFSFYLIRPREPLVQPAEGEVDDIVLDAVKVSESRVLPHLHHQLHPGHGGEGDAVLREDVEREGVLLGVGAHPGRGGEGMVNKTNYVFKFRIGVGFCQNNRKN